MVRRALIKDYERDERRIVREMPRPHHRVLEIGGGIGLIALTARMTVREENILEIEPNLDLILKIEANFQSNGAWIRIEDTAIDSDRLPPAIAKVHRHQGPWSNSLRETTLSRSASVKAAILREVLEYFSPNVLIVDAEGAECEVLKYIHLQDDDLSCIIFHLHETGRSSASELIQSLLNSGFEIDMNRSRAGVFAFSRFRWFPDRPHLPLEEVSFIAQHAHRQDAV